MGVVKLMAVNSMASSIGGLLILFLIGVLLPEYSLAIRFVNSFIDDRQWGISQFERI